MSLSLPPVLLPSLSPPSISPSPSPSPSHHHAHDHYVQFYQADDLLIDTVLQFVLPSLVLPPSHSHSHAHSLPSSNKTAVLIVCTPSHRQSVEDSLVSRGIDVSSMQQHQQLTFLDAQQTIDLFLDPHSHYPDPHRFHTTVGVVLRQLLSVFRHVRVYGEMVSLLCQQQLYESAIQLEGLWNQLSATLSFTLLCGYHMSSFTDPTRLSQFRSICDAHTQVVPAENIDLQTALTLMESTFDKHRQIIPFTLLYLVKDNTDSQQRELVLSSQGGTINQQMDAMIPTHIPFPSNMIISNSSSIERSRSRSRSRGRSTSDCSMDCTIGDSGVGHARAAISAIQSAVETVMQTQQIVDIPLDASFSLLVHSSSSTNDTKTRTGTSNTSPSTIHQAIPTLALAFPITVFLTHSSTPTGVLIFGLPTPSSSLSTTTSATPSLPPSLPPHLQNTQLFHFLELLTAQTAALISTVKIHESSQLYLQRQLEARTNELNAIHQAAVQASRLRMGEAEKNTQYHIEFSRMLAHEIRNPLQASSCSVDLLYNELNRRASILHKINQQGGTVTSADLEILLGQIALDQEYLESIEASVRHQTIVTNGVLEAAKIDANKMVLAAVEYEVASKIKEVIAMLKPQAVANHTKIYFTALVTEDIVIIGDPDRLAQVLVNVLVNALKFTSYGSVTISLDIKAIDSPSPHSQEGQVATVGITIADTGCGMSEASCAQLFQRFSTVTSSSFHQFVGTGLGLYYCKKFIELMGGNITVSSEVGKGTVFTILFKGKLVKTPSPTSKTHRSSRRLRYVTEKEIITARPTPRLNIAASPLHVLVVEDNEVNRRLLCRMLTHEGFTCLPASNGQEALNLLRANNHDFYCIFMDCHMPGMDGFTCTKIIRSFEQSLQRQTHIPIVCLTGDQDQLEATKQAGMDYYLTKPINWSKLQSIIVTVEQGREKSSSSRSSSGVVVSSAVSAACSVPSPSPSPSLLPLPGLSVPVPASVVNVQFNMFVNAATLPIQRSASTPDAGGKAQANTRSSLIDNGFHPGE